MRSTAVLALALITAACTEGGTAPTMSDPTTTSSETAATTTLPPVVECPGEGDFQEGGGIADIDGTGSDSASVGRISWEASDLCENFHFEFETSEGAPATMVPDIRVDHLESFQVVRVTMDVEATVITDQLVETNLVERLYVVRSLDGSMYVDLHLAEPAAARAVARSSPARLNLDLRPGFVPFSGESTIGDNVVLVSPTAGTVIEDTTQFEGYARTLEPNVLLVVTQGGSVVTQTNTPTTDDPQTWGEYRIEVDLPAGDVSVFVGETRPADGGLEGITVDLTVN